MPFDNMDVAEEGPKKVIAACRANPQKQLLSAE